MGFRILGSFFLMLLFQLRLLPAFPISIKNLLPADFDQPQNARNEGIQEGLSIEVGNKHVVSVNRRGGGGGGGGHGGGGGGHSGGSGGEGGHSGGNGGEEGHGNSGDKTPYVAGGAVIVAGAGGAHHRNDHQHHGANGATPLCSDFNYLVLVVFSSVVIFV